MEVLEILQKFNYKNIVVVDNENYFDCTIGKYINETLPIYEYLIGEYGNDVLEKRICDCDNDLLDVINVYIENENPYAIIDKIKHNVNFNYFSSILDYHNDTLIEGNTLWFVDIKMDVDDNYDHIKTLYRHFYDRIKNEKNDIFILFSNQAYLYNSIDKLKDFLETNVKLSFNDCSAELNTNILEKNKIDAKIIYSLILKASKSKFFDLLLNSINISLNRLKENIFDFDKNLNLFHYDYLTEGKSFDESLFDVFQFELKNNYLSNLDYSFFAIMNNAIDYYLENKSFDLKENKVLWRIAKLINDFDSPYFIDNSVNKLYHDIAFGDIFIIGSKYYMIANQACDLAIRDSGDRKNFYALLVPIQLDEMNNEKLLDYKINIASSIIKKEKLDGNIKNNVLTTIEDNYNLKLKSSGTNHAYHLVKIFDKVFNLNFKKNSELLTLPFWIIDNVCCNCEGVVDFNYITDGLRYPLKQRIIKAKKEFETLEERTKGKAKEFLSIAYFNTDSLNINRVGKINFELANWIYKEFVSEQSRVPNEMVVKLK